MPAATGASPAAAVSVFFVVVAAADNDGDAAHLDDFYGDERGWKVAL